MRSRPVVWIVAFSVAIGLHAVGFLGYSMRPDTGAEDLGVGGQNISITMVAALAGGDGGQDEPENNPVDPPSDNPQEETAEELGPANDVQPEESEPAPEPEPMPEPIPEPEQVPEPIPEPEPVPEPVPEPEPEQTAFLPRPQPPEREPPKPQPEIVTPPVEAAEPVVQPQPAVDVTKQAEADAATAPQTAPQVDAPSAASSSAAAGQVSAGVAENAPVGESPDVMTNEGGGAVAAPSPDYISELRYWLERHKTYPKQARRKRMQGIVVIAFRVFRDGRIEDARIRDLSEHDPLNEEAMAMLERAAPLPTFPPSMKGDHLDLVIPVEFSLRGNR
ncbi:MAG: TonB family protein [Alphaproteobacteria bacterium]